MTAISPPASEPRVTSAPEEPPATTDRAWGRPRWRPWYVDVAVVLVLTALVFVVHDIHALLTPTYWLDEAWVAVSRKAPWSQLPLVTSSTPLGFTVAVRLIPWPDRLRLLTLVGHVLTVALAYCLGRRVRWPGLVGVPARVAAIATGVGAGGAALILPAEQLRSDLKQYTLDAAVTLALFVWATRLETRWSRRGLAVLAVGGVAGMLFSLPSALVTASIFVALCSVELVARRWRRLVEAVVAGATAAVGLGAYYVLVAAAARNPANLAWWRAEFPPVSELGTYVVGALNVTAPTAFGISWQLFVISGLLGVIGLYWAGLPATAVAALVLPLLLTVLGVAQVYPLLDERTSHFLYVLWAAFAGIGVAGIGVAVTRLLPRLRSHLAAGPVAASLSVVLLVLVAFTWHVHGSLRRGVDHTLDYSRVAPAVAYVEAHRRPGDVVLVNLLGCYGFAFYWGGDQPDFVPNTAVAVGFMPTFPDKDRIVCATDLDATHVAAALTRAEIMAGRGGRVWLIRGHVNPDELTVWTGELASRNDQTLAPGVDLLTVR